MSLQVWLPLNGNINNYGLNGNIIIENNNSIINNNGKIGKCYNFNGIDSYFVLNNYNMNDLSEYSISCWVKPVSTINGLFLVRKNGTHQIHISSNGFSFRDTNNSTIRTIPFGNNFIANEWCHICCVYRSGEIFLYQNGIQTQHNDSYYHINSKSNIDNTEIRIGRSQTSSNDVYYNGYINDFRIYDHALSFREVKELAKGLILHYKLDEILYNNLINKELDCSGYKQDGIINGIIEKTINSSRYRTSCYFDSSSFIEMPHIYDINTLIKNFSVSCWIKKNYSDNNERHFYYGIVDLYIYTDGKLRISWKHTSDDLNYNTRNTWATGITIPNNEWTYIVFTFNNGIINVYINGQYIKTSNRSNNATNIQGYQGNFIGKKTESTNAFIGNISDLRLYCTVLSSDEIKALYKDACYIDKNNNFYAYEYVENGINSPQISKKGVFYIPEEIKEDNNYQANIDELNIYTNHEFYEL